MAVKAKKEPSTKRELHLKVPEGIDFKDFAADGLLVPQKLSGNEALVPLDFTSISSREVGHQHSFWAVRHSYLIYLVGILRADAATIKHDLKNAEASWMIKHIGDFKNKWEAEHVMGRDKRIKRLREKLIRAEASLIRYDALSVSYDGLRNAASREMSRRDSERASRD